MDYKEEQEQELEVLESIYPDELEVLSGEYPNIKFSVLLKLELNDTAMHDNELLVSLNKVHLLEVTFQFPENYPDMAPIVTITPFEQPLYGGDSDEDSDEEEEEEEEEQEYDEHGNKVLSKLENLPDQISFREYIPELLKTIQTQIDEDMLLGMQMCFALLATVKESAENWFVTQLDELDRQHQQEIERREAQEQKKFNGTKVTQESYLEWRARFRTEMGIDERDRLRREAAHHGRLTGKQMFEQGVAGTTDDADADAEDASASASATDVESVTKDLKSTGI